MRARLKPGTRVQIVGSSKYGGRTGRISQVNPNMSGTITYFVALDTPFSDNGQLVLEVRADSTRVRPIER